MSKSFVSVGVTILDIVGYPISAIPAGEGTEVIEKIHLCAAGTAAQVATAMGSDGGVRDYDSTLKIMQAGSMSVIGES